MDNALSTRSYTMMCVIKKRIKIFATLFLFFFVLAGAAHAANTTVPLQIPLPDKNIIEVCAGEKCKGVAEYVASAYRFLVGLAAVLAVIALSWGGLRWLTSGGESSKIDEARKVIANAVIGLLLALGSYTILLTINPALTAFNPVVVKPIKAIDLTIYDWELHATGGNKDQTAQAVPVTGCPSNPTVSFLGKSYTKSMFGEHWADVLCREKISFFLVNRKTHEPKYSALTDVHELTHRLNGSSGKLYIGNGKYLDYEESEKITLDDVVKRLPQVLRDGDKTRFDIYLNTKTPDISKTIDKTWEGGVGKQNNGSPVGAVLDDFSAYDVNAKSFVEIYENNLPGKTMSEVRGGYSGPPSFVAYGLALAKTLEDKDPQYLKNDTFKKTLKALIEDGMKSYKTAARIAPGEIEEDTKKMYDALRTHSAADDLRDLARRWYGSTWTKEWLGFD